jgi:hypothetical protein
MSGGDAVIDVSVIVPVNERPEELEGLYQEYARPLHASGRRVEFVFITGPEHEHLLGSLAKLSLAGERVRALEVAQTMGDAALIKAAASKCAGDIVVVMPAYRRIQASALPRLVEAVESGAELAAAWRWPHSPSWFNRLQNRSFHFLVGGLTDRRLHDVAAGVTAMRRSVLQELPIYGDFGRFLPVVALRDGYQVVEVQADRHPEDGRRRIYAPGTYLRRLLDVLGLYFLLRFLDKPLRFFGMIGSFMMTLGMVALVSVTVARIEGQGIADRPMLLLGVLLLVMGAQAVALGLVGEIVVHLHAPKRRPYRLWRELVLMPSRNPASATVREATAGSLVAHGRPG